MDALTIYKTVGIILTGYLLGAVPFCYIIGRVHSKKKLTEIGDRNPGGWNLLFNVSKFWGFVGMFLDVFKGFIVYFLALKFTNIEDLLKKTNAKLQKINLKIKSKSSLKNCLKLWPQFYDTEGFFIAKITKP